MDSVLPPGVEARFLGLHYKQGRSRLWAPEARKRPNELMPEPEQRSEPVEEKFDLLGEPTEMPAALAAVEPNDQPIVERVTCRFVFQHVAAFYGVTVAGLGSHRKDARIVWPRQIAMYLARELTLQSLPEIGRRLGGKDHTTVLYGARKIESELTTNAALAVEVAEIRRRIVARLSVGVSSDVTPTTLPAPGRGYGCKSSERWTDERKAALRSMWFDNVSMNKIAASFGRHPQTIRERAALMGLPRRHTPDWKQTREAFRAEVV